jgi:hypothetical protein
MRPSQLASTALALGLFHFAAAQTSTSCNPLNSKCPDDAALGKSVQIDFTKGASPEFSAAEGTTINYDPSQGAAFQITSDLQAPMLESNKYIFFGRVSATVKAAPGVGIISSIVLESDDLDEIDWEWSTFVAP